MLTFIIGGARSGKSKFAQSLCRGCTEVTYVATARVEDDEMRARVERHRHDRPPHWRTIEEPLRIGDAVRRAAAESQMVLIDCLTVWISNILWKMRDEPAGDVETVVLKEIDAIAASAATHKIVMVSNEVGSGIVPESALARFFRDLQGLANQHAAAAADQVYLTVAGIPVPIKAGPSAKTLAMQEDGFV